MGYSIATPIRSNDLKQKMLRFLKKNWRNWPTLVGRPEDPQYLSDPRGGGLAYDHGKCRIGFDFNASEGERMYGWCACAWMALKVGRKRNGHPHFMYDGDEVIPVIVGSPKTDADEDHHDRYSEIGVLHLGRHDLPYTYPPGKDLVTKALRRLALKPVEDERRKDREIIRKEIERLDALWEAES